MFIALICAVGVTVWVSKKFYKSTGGNSTNSYVAGVVTGVVAFLIMLSLLSLIPN